MSFLRRSFVPGLSVAALIVMLPTILGAQLATAQVTASAAQTIRPHADRAMTLEPMTIDEKAAQNALAEPRKVTQGPDEFREFGSVRAGQVADTRKLTLRFNAAAALTKIDSTPDFKVEQGGSCVEGFSYAANETCTLLVRFTPQGPGRRTGKVTVTNSVDLTPLAFGIGGNGSSPAVSFTPSIISTVPGTYVSGAGLIKGASNLFLDKGDTLYVADTGNNLVRYMDSSGVFNAISSGVTAPVGVVIDNFGEVFFTEPSQNAVFETYDYENAPFQISGSGTDVCTYSTSPPCSLSSEQVSRPDAMAIDSSGQLYFTESYYGAVSFNSNTLAFVRVSDPFYYQSTKNGFAVDASGNLYTGWLNAGEECQIMYQSYSDAYYGIGQNTIGTKVAGGRTCGFSGDGGQAGNAEIGTTMGQIAFDVAGNLYFTDSSNQRVRRIDALTGIITTIAGNGSIGYSGDNGPATGASLNTPTGVGVDSQGQVYVISSSATTGSAQVVRKVGTIGLLNLGGLAVGTSSTAQTVTVANTGNADLDYTHVGLSGGNTSDFAIDPNTTSCNFTVPLASGHSCKIGFIFTPSAIGNRNTTLTMTDDTVTGVNTIQLTGAGYTTATLTPISFSFASTTVGSSSASQTATLTNTGKAAMNINSIVFSGANVTSFSDSTNCGTTLAIGASCTIVVTFKPAATGNLSAVLTINDTALGGHQNLALSGVGAAAAAKASITPTSLTFPSTAVGATSAGQSIKLSNTGTAALGITSIMTTGTNPADFPLSQNCGTSVAAGGSCTITLTFKPAATGTRSATVTIAASTGTLTASVTGAAAAAAKKTVVTLSQASGQAKTQNGLVLNAQVIENSSAAATGSVQLWEETHLWAASPLSEGSAAFAMGNLSPGVHFLSAVYIGSEQQSGLRSAVLTVVVPPVSHFSHGANRD